MSSHNTDSELGGGFECLVDVDVGNVEEIMTISIGAEGLTLDGNPFLGSL